MAAESNVLEAVLTENIPDSPLDSSYGLDVYQADLNNDGKPDLVFTDTSNGSSEVVLATSTGFSATQEIGGDYLAGYTTLGSAADGTVYLIDVDYEGLYPGDVFRDDGTGTFVYQPRDVPFGQLPTLSTSYSPLLLGKNGASDDTVVFNTDGTVTVGSAPSSGGHASVTYSVPLGLPYTPTADDLLGVISSGQQFALVFATHSLSFGESTVEVLAGTLEAACYVEGTRLLTPEGERPIEALHPGDLLVTASGTTRPVRWVGRRTIDCMRHPEPARVHPVRVQAGAFGPGVPHTDLWLSPGHAVRVEGGLVPVELLLNGATVAQVPVARVTYLHVELDAHDLVLAQGLAAESFLDVGNRCAFEGEEALLLHPDLSAHAEAGSQAVRCLPMLGWGEEVVAARARLLQRAEVLGHATDEAHGLHLLVDGREVAPSLVSGEWHHFAVPEGARTVILASRTWVPSHLRADTTDHRQLGVCVLALVLDGRAWHPEHVPPAAGGWHGPCAEGRPHRWTDGRATLPVGLRSVAVLLGGERCYRSTTSPRVVDRRAA